MMILRPRGLHVMSTTTRIKALTGTWPNVFGVWGGMLRAQGRTVSKAMAAPPLRSTSRRAAVRDEIRRAISIVVLVTGARAASKRPTYVFGTHRSAGSGHWVIQPEGIIRGGFCIFRLDSILRRAGVAGNFSRREARHCLSTMMLLVLEAALRTMLDTQTPQVGIICGVKQQAPRSCSPSALGLP